MPTKIVYEPNYTVVGSPTIDSNYVASGFNSSSGILSNKTITNTFNTFEIGTVIITGSSISSNQIFLSSEETPSCPIALNVYSGKFALFLSSSYSTWNIASQVTGSHTLSSNTKYWVKLVYNGTQYILSYSTDGTNYTDTITINNSTNIASFTPTIGGWIKNGTTPDESYFTGSIDLKNTYININGEEVWRPVIEKEVDVSGSINISKGYYNNGTYEIFMPDSQVYLGTLKSGETVGCKNKTFAYSYNDVAGVKITAESNNDITTTHDVSVNLSHPIYLNYAKEYIVGDTPLASLGMTFSNGGYGTPDYTIVGSPTISSEYVLSNTSNSKYIKSNTTTPSSLTSFDIIMKYVKTDSATSIRYLAADRNSNTVFYTENNKIGYYDPSNNNTIGTNTISLNTAYWIRWKLESGTLSIYKLLDNDYTLDTLPAISSWTLEATKNSFNTSYLQNKTMVIGAHPNTGTYGSGGNIYLADTDMYMNGSEWWRPIPVLPTAISTTTTGFLYNQTADKTFWYPQLMSRNLEDFSVDGDRCNLFLVNASYLPYSVIDVTYTDTPTLDIGLVDSYLQQGYVYLNHANDKILGVGTEPDEIVLEAIDSDSDNVLDTITADPVHNWDYLGESSEDLSGVSLAISTLSPSSLTGYLLASTSDTLNYSENNAQGSGYYYTGYNVTFTDNTYTAISSLTKAGERCRVYQAIDGTPGHESTREQYVYVPYRWWNQLQTDTEPHSYALPYSTAGAIDRVEIAPSNTVTAIYYKSTDTFTIPGSPNLTAEYVGDFYFNSNL